MNIPVITLTSDFGDQFASAQLELVCHSIAPDTKFIHLENNVEPFNIVEGAFILSKAYGFAPEKSVHIGVIDPGVGSERKGVIIKSKNYWFVGPDNGLFYPAANTDGIEKVYVIDETKAGSITNTFHGRDVFAKAAAWLATGRNPEEFTKPFKKEDLVTLTFEKNQIVHIDPYGNIKLHASPTNLKRGQKVKVRYAHHVIETQYCKTFADVAEGEFLVYHGSHQTLELAINLRSAADHLNAQVGDVIEIHHD